MYRSFRYVLWLSLLAAVLWPQNSNATVKLPRIVLLNTPGQLPSVYDVRQILREDLKPSNVRVHVLEQKSTPIATDKWQSTARAVRRRRAGTLAVFGWKCDDIDKRCTLTMVETRSLAVTHFPIGPPAAKPTSTDPDAPKTKPSLSFTLASTIRETVLSRIFNDLERISNESKNPSPPPPSGVRPPTPYKNKTDEIQKTKRVQRPWFWLEGGYQGDLGHPSRTPVHGPVARAAFAPGKNVVPVISIGWLGMDSIDRPVGELSAFRFPISLILRVAIPAGPAMFSIAPAGRFDLLVTNTETIDGKNDQSLDLEIHVGGLTAWHFPLPKVNFDLVIGTGILVSILSECYELNRNCVSSESFFRFVWSAGISWSPL